MQVCCRFLRLHPAGTALKLTVFMKKKHGRSFLANWFWHILQSPAKVVELVFFLLLTTTLAYGFVNFAGFLPYAPKHALFSLLMIGVAAVQGLLVYFRKDSIRFQLASLLPIPFLGYLFVHSFWISPVPWVTELYVMVFLQAYGFYVIVLNALNRGSGRMQMLIIVYIAYFLMVLVACFQFYLFPDWSPLAQRLRAEQFAHGAAGWFSDPQNLGALVLVLLPSAYLILLMRRFAGPVRIFCGFISFFGFVLYFLSSHLFGLLILMTLILVVPFFATGERYARMRMLRWQFLFILIFLPLFWFGTDALRERMEYYLTYQADTLSQTSRGVAYSAFLGAPVFGNGLGSFSSFWDSMTPGVVGGESLYAVSAYAGWLAELGIVGLILLLLPAVWIWGNAYRKWRNTAFIKVDPDVESRLRKLSPRRRARERARLSKGRVPGTKVVLGGLLLGLAAMSLYIVVDYSIHLPAVMFFLAFIFATLVNFSSPGVKLHVGERYRFTMAMLPLILFTWAYGFGVRSIEAQWRVTEAGERLAMLESQSGRIFHDPALVYEAEFLLEQALELSPENGEAWLLLGQTRFLRLSMEIYDVVDIANLALSDLLIAKELFPQDWRVHFNLSRALALRGDPIGEILPHLERARQMAPFRAEPLAFLTALQSLQPHSDRQQLQINMNQAIALDPDYEPARLFLSRFAMAGGAGAGSVNQRILTPALIAEDFHTVMSRPQRIEGAGTLDPQRLGGVTPDLGL